MLSPEDSRLIDRALDHEQGVLQAAAAVTDARGDAAAARGYLREFGLIQMLRHRLEAAARAHAAKVEENRRRGIEIRRRQADRLNP